jgi:hypothetical protein
MYNPPTFLTMEVLADVLAEFDWPAPYILEEHADGIVVRFPRASLYVTEGFESHMRLTFLRHPRGLDRNIDLVDALVALRSEQELPEIALIDDAEPFATLSKVQNGVRDLCTLVLSYFRPTLLGDTSWVVAYQRRFDS